MTSYARLVQIVERVHQLPDIGPLAKANIRVVQWPSRSLPGPQIQWSSEWHACDIVLPDELARRVVTSMLWEITAVRGRHQVVLGPSGNWELWDRRGENLVASFPIDELVEALVVASGIEAGRDLARAGQDGGGE